jgi:hypothetical protein
MIKVSITLPNNAQITFESEEPEFIHQIVEIALRELPKSLMLTAMPTNGGTPSEPSFADKALLESEHRSQTPIPSLTMEPRPTSHRSSTQQPVSTTSAGAAERLAFKEFCQSANPTGDMRRVVVAAEGARRFLSLSVVNADGLGWLFDLAGWRRPHSFVQTLRNSARSKFRWLERIPGRSGNYSLTDLGQSIALGPS